MIVPENIVMDRIGYKGLRSISQDVNLVSTRNWLTAMQNVLNVTEYVGFKSIGQGVNDRKYL